jgi:phage shock protein E
MHGMELVRPFAFTAQQHISPSSAGRDHRAAANSARTSTLARRGHHSSDRLPTRLASLGLAWRWVTRCALLAMACSKSEPAPQPPTAPETADVAAKSAPAPAKDPAAARQAIAAGALVIDVRTAEEYGAGHVTNAVNIPVDGFADRLSQVAQLAANDKAKAIVVYCAAGKRAARAKQMLDGAGYTHVVNGGGYDDLR